MSIFDGLPSFTHTDFNGPNLLVDEEDVKDPQGLFDQDVEFIAGQARTRRGFGVACIPHSPSLGALIQTFCNWLSSTYNRLVYYAPAVSGGSVIQRDLHTNIETSIISGVAASGAIGCTYTPAGYRMIISFFKSDPVTGSPIGAQEGIVWDGTQSVKLFPRPLLHSDMRPTSSSFNAGLVFTEPSSGVVSPGLHYFGFILTSTAGAESPPGPGDSVTEAFSYLNAPSFTAAGGKNLRIAIDAVWPVGATQVQLIMTPVNNPSAWYKVPDAIFGVPPYGAEFTFNLIINLSDVTLSGASTDPTADVVQAGYFALLSQDVTGSGPIKPSIIGSFNSRTVYAAQDLAPDGASLTSALFISEISLPQWITRLNHEIYLPDFLPISTHFVNGNILYVLGPQWTFAYGDNGLYPVQWATPRTVSRSIGTPFPYGVANNSTLNYAWVADAAGLFQMQGGFYPSLPVSYYQTPDWLQINFSAPSNALFVVEDPNRRLVMVFAPVGSGQQTANKALVWDYTEGSTPEKIKYCGMWNIVGGAYAIGGAQLVYNLANGNKEMWIARTGTVPSGQIPKILRQKYAPADAIDAYQPALYDDDGVGIDAQYRFGPLAPMQAGPTTSVGAMFRIRGNGNAALTAYSMDTQSALALNPILSLIAKPSRWFTRLFDKQSESVSIQVQSATIAAGNFWIVAAIKYYFNRWMDSR